MRPWPHSWQSITLRVSLWAVLLWTVQSFVLGGVCSIGPCLEYVHTLFARCVEEDPLTESMTRAQGLEYR